MTPIGVVHRPYSPSHRQVRRDLHGKLEADSGDGPEPSASASSVSSADVPWPWRQQLRATQAGAPRAGLEALAHKGLGVSRWELAGTSAQVRLNQIGVGVGIGRDTGWGKPLEETGDFLLRHLCVTSASFLVGTRKFAAPGTSPKEATQGRNDSGKAGRTEDSTGGNRENRERLSRFFKSFLCFLRCLLFNLLLVPANGRAGPSGAEM